MNEKGLLRRPERPLRVAQIGAGPWGANIIRSLSSLPNVSLKFLCTSQEERAKLAPPQCSVVRNWRELLLQRQDFDVAIVATPAETHHEILMELLASKIPCFVEKPFVLSPRDARDVVALAQQKAVPLFVDYIFLFNTAFRKLQTLVKEMGPIRFVRSCGGNMGPFRSSCPLWDWAPHDLSMILSLAGKGPERIELTSLRDDSSAAQNRPFARNFEFTLTFDSFRADVKCGNLFEKKTRRLEVYFEDKAIVFDDLEPIQKLRIVRSYKDIHGRFLTESLGTEDVLEEIATDPGMPLAKSLEECMQFIERGEPSPPPLSLSLQITDVLAELDKRVQQEATQGACRGSTNQDSLHQ